MRLSDFEAMVSRLSHEVPPEFLEGVAEIVVSPRAVPHPSREEIYTLGECIPLPEGTGGGGDAIQSRVVLYHGSFLALSRLTDGFDWREEAWETLTHELRHHLEWRARAPDLEDLDWAVEQNFARHDGESFDPGFYLQGEPLGEDVWRVEDDVFLDRTVGRVAPSVRVVWRGRFYDIRVPPDAGLPAFLTLEGVEDPPPGELVLVLRRKPGLRTLLRPGKVYAGTVRAEPPGYLSPP